MPRPADIQLTSPGRIAASVPRLSRWMISPSNRKVTVASPIWGCGRTSMPWPARNSAGPKWSKKMNGPTMRRLTCGSARRTSKWPTSTLRGTTTRSMASAARTSPGAGSLAGKKLMTIFSVADPQPAVAEKNNILSFPWRLAGRDYGTSSGSVPVGLPAASSRIFSTRASARRNSSSQRRLSASPRS